MSEPQDDSAEGKVLVNSAGFSLMFSLVLPWEENLMSRVDDSNTLTAVSPDMVL